MTDQDLNNLMTILEEKSRINPQQRRLLFNYYNELFPKDRQTNTTCATCIQKVITRMKYYWLENIVSQTDPEIAQAKLQILNEEYNKKFRKRNNLKSPLNKFLEESKLDVPEKKIEIDFTQIKK